METGWITLRVVDRTGAANPELRCAACGGEGADREVAIDRLAFRWAPWRLVIHRRCEVKLKKLESEEVCQLYENLSAVQERCTAQEMELRDLRRKLAGLSDCIVHGIERSRCGCAS